jgi:hypothetical protein
MHHMTTTINHATTIAPASLVLDPPEIMMVMTSNNSTAFTDCPPAEPPPKTPSTPSCTNHLDAPPGSVISIITTTPHFESLTIVSEFPYGRANLAKVQSEFHDATILPPASFGTIVWIATCPRVFGLRNDSRLRVRICRQTASLMDGGANICVTGNLSLMVGVVDIPPMAILVAIEGTEVTKDDCCTKRGYTPLSCSDGSI